VVLRILTEDNQHYHKNTSTAKRNTCRSTAESDDDGRDIDGGDAAIKGVSCGQKRWRDDIICRHALQMRGERRYSFAIPRHRFRVWLVFLRRRNTLLRQKQNKKSMVRI